MKRAKKSREIPTQPDALLTEREVAELLGFSPRTLQAWRTEGIELEFVEIGRSIRYRRAVIDTMIQKKTTSVRPRGKDNTPASDATSRTDEPVRDAGRKFDDPESER